MVKAIEFGLCALFGKIVFHKDIKVVVPFSLIDFEIDL